MNSPYIQKKAYVKFAGSHEPGKVPHPKEFVKPGSVKHVGVHK